MIAEPGRARACRTTELAQYGKSPGASQAGNPRRERLGVRHRRVMIGR